MSERGGIGSPLSALPSSLEGLVPPILQSEVVVGHVLIVRTSELLDVDALLMRANKNSHAQAS